MSNVNLAGEVISSVANLISFFSYYFAVYGLILPCIMDSFLISFWDFAICISNSPFDALFLRIPCAEVKLRVGLLIADVIDSA